MTILIGDVREKLRELPDASVHCVVTSPPYWALRDYGAEGQIGSEATPQEFVAVMVDVFREVRRVLRDDGTCWVNLGDTYNAGTAAARQAPRTDVDAGSWLACESNGGEARVKVSSLKPKDMCGIPWRVALALQADGWWLRQDIIWHKPSPMPESVTDRCTKAHEYIFLLTKRERYFYDADAIAEPSICAGAFPSGGRAASNAIDNRVSFYRPENHAKAVANTRNRRSVWTIASEPYSGAHFATFPTKLVEPCILAGTSAMGCCSICGAPQRRVVDKTAVVDATAKGSRFDAGKTGTRDGGNRTQPGERFTNRTVGWKPSCDCGAETMPCTVLDPFFGAGTTGLVAIRAGRRAIGIELNPTYAEMARKRITDELGLLIGEA